MKVMASSSKTLSFRKPLASSSRTAPASSSPARPAGSSPAASAGPSAEESFDESIAAEHSAAQMGTVPAS